MERSTIASLISLAFTSPVFAAENINLDDIVVTASRTQQSRTSVVGDVTVINREEIERAGAGSITDLLRTQPGVQISTNGGAGTGSSVYLRGTNADHVVVLVDGLRINSATLGTTSFENIPLGQIERIEILRGPASSLYGADAIGGVIQIFTRKAEAGKPLVHAAVGLGSFDTKTAEAGISGSVNALKYGINVSSLDTDSFSAKRIRTGIDKDDDGYRNLSASSFLELELAKGHTWGLQFVENKGRNNFDNAYNNYGDQTLQSYAFTSKNQFTDIWHSTFKLGMGIDDSDSHAKPDANPASSSFNPQGISEFRTEQLQLTWQNDFKLPLGTLTLAYDRLEQDVDSRSNVKSKFKKERNTDSFLAGYVADIGNHAIQASLREDHNTQFGNYTAGGAGYAYRITPELRVSANYGNAFKAPTFNQLYFPNFGDPSLSPEKSDNIEASLKYSGHQFNVGMTVFENKIRNLIASIGPATSGCTFAGLCPVNVGKVEIQGASFDANWNISDSLLLSGNFTVQSPRDDKTDNLVPRRGNRYGAMNLLHTWGYLQWGAEVTGASTRYNDLANQFKMSGYALVNLTANYRMTPEWKLEMRANNVLDKNYVLSTTKSSFSPNNPDYNTAGSNLFVGLRYDMKP
ncbi:MAG: TonB-dependent receptor [Methylotenera sp.]|nr:TonB-dependent receptor [Methylotenera sp.]MDP1960235.1 TonB-dependent receptor [Methylotenera sp.]MDP3206391.1 TonB-dependent receptor [Methylotenera sp.]MDP3303947.1 TonB-dependent receptor [Methylotenera sp.]MDP3942688.1 TonB-dependent receptor [Methylotenera sp.]